MKKTTILLLGLLIAAGARAEFGAVTGENSVAFIQIAPQTGGTDAPNALAVPFRNCLSAADGRQVAWRDLVSTNGLPGAALDADADTAARVQFWQDGGYSVYYLNTTGGWTRISGNAAADKMEAGTGFWLTLPAGAATEAVCLQGELLTCVQSNALDTGFGLFSLACTTNCTLGGLDFSGAYAGARPTLGDQVLIPDGTGAGYTAYYYGKKRGTASATWLDGGLNDATGVALPAGRAFWFKRVGTTGFTFRPFGAE